jgi:hypothetical protein
MARSIPSSGRRATARSMTLRREGSFFPSKGGRIIPHMKRLKDVETPLANFFASGVLRLEEKLGPFCGSYPRLCFDPERLRKFFNLLPRATPAAAKLAKKHAARAGGLTARACSGTRSRFDIRRLIPREFIPCCGSMTSRWSWPIRLANGR